MDLIKGGKILVFHDRYGIPVKAADKERLGEPECGFLFPACTDRRIQCRVSAVMRRVGDYHSMRLSIC